MDPFSANNVADKMFIVLDNVAKMKYEGTYTDTNSEQSYNPVFSRDGEKITYTAIKNGKNIIVVNDEEYAEFIDQNYPQFVGDTYEIAYLARDNNESFLIVAGEKKAEHNDISHINTPFYVGNGASQIASMATDNDTRSIIVNDAS